MNRRSFLSLSTAAFAGSHLHSNAYEVQAPRASFDHILFGISSLEAGIKIIKEKTGVEAAFGGEQPDRGTHSALLSLGDHTYLEILAPIPGGKIPLGGYSSITNLHQGKLIRWAAHTDNIDALIKVAKDSDHIIAGMHGQRVTPDGKTLTWRSLHVLTSVDEVMPFFIQWDADSPHPATTSP